VDVVYEYDLPPLIADDETTSCALTYMKELLGPMAMQFPEAQTGGGSEDFAFVSSKVPSVPLVLAAGNSKDGYAFPAHNNKVRFDESALPVGAAAHAYMALRWLADHK
jgi:hippurate hydrolase